MTRGSALSVRWAAAMLLLAALPAAEPAPLFAPAVQRFVDEGVMSGAVMLEGTGAGIRRLEAVGFGDLATRRAMRTDDLFWIASMTKTVTGAAFMILVDEGKVGLDDPVERYIPAFAGVQVAGAGGKLVAPSHPVRVREILSHTSGMRFLNAKDQGRIDSVPLATSVAHALLEPLLSDPGTAYAYSNEGIDAAGLIIEIVAGMPYERFLHERLFAPLGMVDTTFVPNAAQVARLAKSYRRRGKALEEIRIGYLTYPLDGPGRHPAPGGGLFSTAHDVARFCQMLAAGGTLDGRTYLSVAALRQLASRQTAPGMNCYGLGCDIAADGTTFGHGGAYRTWMRVVRGQVLVFLVQHDGDWAGGDPFAAYIHQAESVR